MDCPICKSGSTSPGHTTFVLERDGAAIVFREVPAQVCETCGEAYLDEATTARLLDMANRAIDAGVELEVQRFVAA